MEIYRIESIALAKISKQRLIDEFVNAKLYVVIDSRFSNGRSYLKLAKAAIAGGAKIIQLRDKKLPTRKLIAVGKKLKKLCFAKGVLFIVNNSVEVAVATDADGIHLGHLDVNPKIARKLIGYEKIIGYSTHGLKQALSIDFEVDYISVGPIYATESKPEYKAVGLDLIRKVKKIAKVPFVAIGGINNSNVSKIAKAGAKMFAVIRAVTQAKNPEKAARKLLKNFA